MDSKPHSERFAYLREMTAKLVSLVDPDVVGDVIGPEGQHEGRYRLARIEHDIADNLTCLEEQLDAVQRERDSLREAAVVVVDEFHADNPFVGYAVEELARRVGEDGPFRGAPNPASRSEP